MMKKDLLNKQVVRAISLGLSAVMLTTPMTALANESTDVEPADVQKNNSVEQDALTAQEVADLVDVAKKETGAISDTDNLLSAEEAAKALAETNTNTKVIEERTEETVAGSKVQVGGNRDKVSQKEVEYSDVTIGDDNDADGILDGNENGQTDGVADASDAVKDIDVESVKNSVQDVYDAEILVDDVTEAEEAYKEVTQKLNDAGDKANAAVAQAEEAAKKATNAATKEEAQSAIDLANEALDKAEDELDKANKAVEDKQEQLKDLRDKISEAEEELANAKNNIATTAGHLEDAENDLKAAEKAAAALQAELEKSLKEAEAAKANVKEVQLLAKYAEMKKAFRTKNYDTDYEVSGENEFSNQFGNETNPTAYWNAAREYFFLYIQSMYENNPEFSDVKYAWSKENNTTAQKNTYMVTYTDKDGNVVNKYYNYHIADTVDETGKQTGDITIFEKAWKEPEPETETKDGYYDSEGKKVALTEQDVVAEIDGERYVKGQQGDTDYCQYAQDYLFIPGTKTEAKEPIITYEDGVIKESYKSTAKFIGGQVITRVNLYRDYNSVYKAAYDRLLEVAKEFGMESNGAEGYGGKYLTFPGIKINMVADYNARAYNYEIVTVGDYEVTYYTTEVYDASKVEQLEFEKPNQNLSPCWHEKVLAGAEKGQKNAREAAQLVVDDLEGYLKSLEEHVKNKKAAAALAEKEVEQAKDAVKKAYDALVEIKAAADFTESELSTVKEAYEKALDEYDEAEEKAKKAREDLEDARDEMEEVQELVDNNFRPVSSDDNDDDNTAPYAAPFVTPETPVAGEEVVTPVADAGTGAGAGAAVVNIEDEETPLAAGINNADANGNADTEEVIDAEANDDDTAVVAIEDEETPLAPGAEEKANMSWWWLLIVALLGATGYKMYKDHQKKKEEAQEA